ncbi:MAG: hypothetical protein HWE26_04125 [Alteromonadaceae bacterium]|nr:hypothetical protein [Alteromonadaceae bacterium]
MGETTLLVAALQLNCFNKLDQNHSKRSVDVQFRCCRKGGFLGIGNKQTKAKTSAYTGSTGVKKCPAQHRFVAGATSLLKEIFVKYFKT